jgi:transketolase
MNDLRKIAHCMRIRALELAYRSGKNGAHLGGGLSAIEIFATLYGAVLNYNYEEPESRLRDRLIVSKGHCVLAYYTALEYKNLLSREELDNFEVNGSLLHGHATRTLSKGIEFSGGSLSMGMSFAIGVALACKKAQIKNHIYVIVGDGECDEGLIWESLMSASNFNLCNLTLIVDSNKLQYDGPITKIMNLGSLIEKIRSFGFFVQEADGHNVDDLLRAFNSRNFNLPNAIIANTVKGKGVSFMEGKPEWHHSTLSKEQYELALSEQIRND